MNTTSSRTRQLGVREYLPGYGAVAALAWQLKLLSKDQALQLQDKASENPQAARRAYRAAIDLREALYRIFAAIVRDDVPRNADMSLLNEWLVRARSLQRLTPAGETFRWRWHGAPHDLDAPALLVALSAAEFLAHEDLSRLKVCAPPDGCGWLFFDEARNRSRRWCSMDTCGSWAKSRHFRERQGR